MVGFFRGLRPIVILLALILAWAGCSSNTEIGNPKSQSIFAFESQSAVDRYLRDQLSEDIVRKTPAEGGAETPAPDGDFSPAPALEEPSVQNPVIVTDAAIFAAGFDQVNILLQSPGSPPEVVAALSGTGNIRSLFQWEDRIVVAGEIPGAESFPVRQRISVWDVADPERPVMTRQWEVEGAYLDAAQTSGTLFLAHQFLPPISPFLEAGAFGETAGENLVALEDLPPDALFPRFDFREGEGSLVSGGVLTPPEAIFRPDWPAGGALTILTALSLSGDDVAPFSTAFVGNASQVFLGDDSAVFSIVRSGGQVIDENVSAAPGDAETALYRIPFFAAEPTVSHFGVLPGVIPEPAAARVAGAEFQALAVSNSADGREIYSAALRLADDRFVLDGMRFLGLEPEIPAVRYDGSVQWVRFPDGRVLGVDYSDPLELPEIGPAILNGEPISLTKLDGGSFLAVTRREWESDGNSILEFQRLIRDEGRILPAGSGLAVPIPDSFPDSQWLIGEVAADQSSNRIAIPLRIVTNPSGAGSPFGGRAFFLLETENGGLEVAGEVDFDRVAPPGELFPARFFPRFFGAQFGLFRPTGFIFGEIADPSGTARWIPFVPVQSS
jgi:hypothetical protein